MQFKRLCALFVFPALAVVSGATAQLSEGLTEAFGEVLDVRVVNIEVTVTGKDGVPVYGLGAKDFVLTVDGTEVPIDYFTEVRGGIGVSPEGREEVVAGIPGIQPGEPGGTSYLLFIDEVFTLAQDQSLQYSNLADYWQWADLSFRKFFEVYRIRYIFSIELTNVLNSANTDIINNVILRIVLLS